MTQADRLARHLAALRHDRGWSLDQLAELSGVSRASLARIEKAQVSPTTETLGKLCAAYGISMSRLLSLVEDAFHPVIPAADRPVWTDPATGFRREIVSPAASGLTGEILLCHLPPHQSLRYDRPPRAGLEHHLMLMEGALGITVDDQAYRLKPGDCLRYRLNGATLFETGAAPADYYLFLL